MTVVTISRGSGSMGKAVAEKAAARLGYACLSRDVLLEASELYNQPEVQLQSAIADAPSFLDRFTHGKQKYIAFIQSALTRHVIQDKIIYHGLAGHLLLKNVSHVLKVRIQADHDSRVELVMKRDRVGQAEAARMIATLDGQRQRWTRSLYDADPGDSSLYDLQISLPRYSIDAAADLICRSVEFEPFKTTPESQRQMEDLALACRIKAALVEDHPSISVVSRYGNVVVYGASGDRQAHKLKAGIDELGSDIEGMNNIEVHADVEPPDTAV